jgi:hypothetical protein
MTVEERRDRLKKWLESVYSDVTEAVVNHHIFCSGDHPEQSTVAEHFECILRLDGFDVRSLNGTRCPQATRH